MAIPGFRNNPIIKEFNGLKRFFRSHETNVSRQRIGDFKKFSEMLGNEEVAFDLMGSVNFGQAKEYSDTDIVIYLRCEHREECDPASCPEVKLYRDIFMNTLVFEYKANPYSIQIVDCINLNQLDEDIKNKQANSLVLLRFGFYRSVCRGINRKLLRVYEDKLAQSPELCSMVEESLKECFSGLIRSSQHSYSFKKYVERMEEEGIKIPPTMAGKIQSYLSSNQE